MNSLAFVSRRIDVLAKSKTVGKRKSLDPNTDNSPSTAATTSNSTATPSTTTEANTKRSLWSLEFLFPPPSSPRPPFLLASPSLPRSRTASRRIRPLLKRLFLVRAFVLIWNSICATFVSWTRYPVPIAPSEPILAEKGKEAITIDSTPPLSLPSPPPNSLFIVSYHHLNSPALQQTISTDASRASTPGLTHKTPFHAPKTLVLDLDETLIHSTSKPILSSSPSGLLRFGGIGFGSRNKGHTVQVVLGGKSTLYHVYKRPFVDYFLRKVSAWYTLVIFTASMQEYADPVIDWLDAGRGILARRFFRESCTQLPGGMYTKDLSVVEQDLSRVCLVDNSPICYRINEDNGIPIEGWTHDPSDEALLDLLPILDSLRFTSDVRRVLGIRGFSQ